MNEREFTAAILDPDISSIVFWRTARERRAFFSREVKSLTFLNIDALDMENTCRMGSFLESVPGSQINPEQAVIMSECRDMVQAAVQDLEEPCRTIVRARMQDLTWQQIADQLDISPSAAIRHMQKARGKLWFCFRNLNLVSPHTYCGWCGRRKEPAKNSCICI